MENPEIRKKIVREFHPKARFLGCQFFRCVSHWFVGPTKEFVEVTPRPTRSSTNAFERLKPSFSTDTSYE